MVVKMLQIQIAEMRRQLEELIARVNGGLKKTGDTHSVTGFVPVLEV